MLTDNTPSCVLLQVTPDELLEIDEKIVLFVTATPRDAAVLKVSPDREELEIVIEDDDSELP